MFQTRPVIKSIFILYLHTYDRTFIFEIQSFRLLPYFIKKTLHIFQIHWVVFSSTPFDRYQPIGETTVACFSMTPRADTQPYMQVVLPAQFNESAQIFVLFPVILPLCFFVYVPKNIRGYYRHSGCLHF